MKKKRVVKRLTRRERLNQAAPALLSAMKYAVQQADKNGGRRGLEASEAYNRCLAAIRKAEGV